MDSEAELSPSSESASELYSRRDRCLSAKLVPTFADKGCHVVSVTDPYGRILGLLDRKRKVKATS
jgi:CBS-domain-containing membrane protein